jgi:hypothetical protein
MVRPRRLALTFAAIAGLCLSAPGLAAAASESDGTGKSAAQRLVETYSPRLMVRKQTDPPCNTDGEQYEATSVGAVLGNPAVKLTRFDGDKEVVLKSAPTSEDIAGLDESHHLDLPGSPLGNTCVYAKDFAALKREGKAPATTYAHIAREAGRTGLAVQYWFFWYFNQFNDLHEGDWEGMQIVFEASDPEDALAEEPSEIGLFQHGSGEKADWQDGKVEKDGTHPVVYPAAGSHATFYEAAVYLGNGRQGSGVGCDNTSAPHQRVNPRPVLVPTNPGPDSRFSWLTYEGRWGQKEKGFNNGPTGPATKARWLEPLTWIEGQRSTNPRLPAGSVVGPTVTDVFCSAVTDVTSFMRRTQDSPWLLIALPACALLLLALLIWGTRWRPVDLAQLRQRRAFGQLLLAAGALYRRHWRTFAAIGLTAIPVISGLAALSALVAGGESGRRIDELVGHSGFHVTLGELISGIGQPIASAVMAAVVIVAVRLLVETGRTGFRDSYRGMARRFWRVVGAQLLAGLMLLLMAITVIGVPFAAWKYVSWLFVQQQILFEDKPLREAFRGSSQLVRGRWWYTLRVAGVFWLIGIATGPVLGFVLIFANFSLVWINVFGSLVFALLIPYTAIGRTLLYFDLQEQTERAPAKRLRERLLRRRQPTAA